MKRQVLSATITFCVGVVMITLARPLLMAGPGAAGAWSSGGVQSFWGLCGIVLAATALYMAIRKDEGDFKALVVVAMALFGVSEISAYFSGFVSSASPSILPILFRIAAGVYSLLAVLAFLTCPPPAGDALRAASAIAAAAIGIVSFSGTAAAILNDAALRRAEEVASFVLLGLTASYMAVRLYASLRRPEDSVRQTNFEASTKASRETPAEGNAP